MKKRGWLLKLWLVSTVSLITPTVWPAEEQDPFAPMFKYPRKIDLPPLKILTPATQTNWVRLKTNNVDCWCMTRPKFFENGDGLSVRVGEDVNIRSAHSWIRLGRAGHTNSEVMFVTPDVWPSYGTRPASFHDFDRNGLCDLKLVFYLGGLSGHGNVGRVFYLYQFKTEWRLIHFVVRDVSYTWECDLDGDGKYELLKAHHQDKEKFTYTNEKRKLGEKRYFQKYLFINAYKVEPGGLKLCNYLSKALPMVFPWSSKDPFDITHDAQFMKFNQFALPDGYTNQVQRIAVP